MALSLFENTLNVLVASHSISSSIHSFSGIESTSFRCVIIHVESRFETLSMTLISSFGEVLVKLYEKICLCDLLYPEEKDLQSVQGQGAVLT